MKHEQNDIGFHIKKTCPRFLLSSNVIISYKDILNFLQVFNYLAVTSLSIIIIQVEF